MAKSERVIIAEAIEAEAVELSRGAGKLANNPMIKMVSGSQNIPLMAELVKQAVGIIRELAEEVDKLKGVENGEK